MVFFVYINKKMSIIFEPFIIESENHKFALCLGHGKDDSVVAIGDKENLLKLKQFLEDNNIQITYDKFIKEIYE